MKRSVGSLILFLALSSVSWASSVVIYVSNGKNPDCPPKSRGLEQTRYVLGPDQAAAALKKYVAGKPNPKLYDAAFVNAGLKFCGKPEERAVFDQLAALLTGEEAPKRAYELVHNYARNPSLLESIEARLKNARISENDRRDLLNARGMTVPPKPSPVPAPSAK